MKVGLIGTFILLVALAAPVCATEQFNGKLESIGLDTITLMRPDKQRITLRVDQGARRLAAPFLGQWVTVEAEVDTKKPQPLGMK